MFGLELQGLMNVGYPLLEGLLWKSKHEIEADIVETCVAKEMEGLAGLVSIVTTMEEAKKLIVKSLHTHADAVNGKSSEHGGKGRGDIIGVTLNGNFEIGAVPVDVIYLIYIREDAL